MDAGLAAMILEEAGGGPAAVEGDADEHETERETRAAKASARKAKPSRSASGASEDAEAEHDEDSPEADADQESESEADQDGDGSEEAESADEAGDAEAGADEGAADEGAEEDADEEGEDDAEGAEDAAAADETPAWAKKRFRRYSQRLRERDREIADLRRRLEGGDTERGTGTRREGPIEHQLLEAETPEDLDAIRTRYEQLEDWAIANRDGIEADPEKPNVQAYTREQVAQVLTTARQALRAIPRREAALAKVRDYNARAVELFPDFDDPDSELSQARDYILQQVPELKRLPNYMIIVGDAVAHEGMRRQKARQAQAATRGRDGRSMPGKPAAAAVRKVPPAVPGAPARAPSQSQQPGRLVKARERAFSSGSEADIASLVEASLSR